MSETGKNEKVNTISADKPVIKKGYFLSNKPSLLPFLKKMASSKYLRWVIIALLPVLVLLRYPVDRVDYDLWWHMALGKYYITNHTLMMDHSIFS